MKRHVAAVIVVVTGSAWALSLSRPVAAQQTAPPAACDKLRSVALPNTTIRSARPVAAGAFKLPTTPDEGGGIPVANADRASYGDLPAFCRVIGVMTLVPGSTINFEVWLPDNWNGNFQGMGNGTWAGDFEYPGMANALRLGAATAATDAGHTGHTGEWYDWEGHREQVTDFHWRSFHETTVRAKSLIRSHYGRAQTLSYLVHPAGGGTRMAMNEIARFPEDYDAVMAGGLATHQTHHAFWQVWIWQATHNRPESFIPATKFPAIHQAALDACDAKDGIKDGVILDPAHCAFDPGVMLCKGADGPACLTAFQHSGIRSLEFT